MIDRVHLAQEVTQNCFQAHRFFDKNWKGQLLLCYVAYKLPVTTSKLLILSDIQYTANIPKI